MEEKKRRDICYKKKREPRIGSNISANRTLGGTIETTACVCPTSALSQRTEGVSRRKPRAVSPSSDTTRDITYHILPTNPTPYPNRTLMLHRIASGFFFPSSLQQRTIPSVHTYKHVRYSPRAILSLMRFPIPPGRFYVICGRSTTISSLMDQIRNCSSLLVFPIRVVRLLQTTQPLHRKQTFALFVSQFTMFQTSF